MSRVSKYGQRAWIPVSCPAITAGWRCKVDEIKVKDAMVPLEEYTTVSHEATLYDAILALDAARRRPNDGKSEHRSVVILDENKKVVGKLTYRDILVGLEPRYDKIGDVQKMRRFGLSGEFVTFMRSHFGLWEGSFRDLCQKAVRTKVTDVVKVPSADIYVDEECEIVEAVHQLMVGTDVSLLVTRSDEVVGILRLIDAFDVVSEQIKACRK
jgi:predicted transcriptional regulator